MVLRDIKTDGWPPVPISLELALAMLRLAQWLVLWGFKTDGWPPAPIPKASPGPAMLRLAPFLVLWDFKTDGWPLVPISVLWGFKTDGWPPVPIPKLPQAQNVVGAGFCHAAAGPLSGFVGFQN